MSTSPSLSSHLPMVGSAKPTKKTGGKKPTAKADTATPAAKPEGKADKKTKSQPKAKKLSALAAAAKVLQETRQPLNCQELVEQMTQKGYWTSPQGKTPQATLYAAILREIKVKGEQSRFYKAEKGRFAATGVI